MEGFFTRKKFISPIGFMSFCSIFLIGLYFLLPIVDPEATEGSLSFLLMGISLALVTIPLWTFNRGAFFHVTEDTVRAKFHWFGKIDCKLSDVTFVFPQINTLTVYFKNGKYDTVMGISNSWQIASFISHRISFEAKERPEILIEKLEHLKRSRKQDLLYCCIAAALMLISPFVLLFLTEEKAWHEFSQTNRIASVLMGTVMILSAVIAFYFANKAGKKNIPLEKLLYEIRRTVIETEPLLPGDARKVFISENAERRLTVFKSPDSDSFYYTVEAIRPEVFNLSKAGESETFESIQSFRVNLEEWIEITDKFLLS